MKRFYRKGARGERAQRTNRFRALASLQRQQPSAGFSRRSRRDRRPRRDERDVVAAAAVERHREERPAELLGRLHRLDLLGDFLIADMLGQPVGDQQDDAPAGDLDPVDDRHRLLAADGTRQDVAERRTADAVGGQDALVGQALGQGLVAGDLVQLALPIDVTAAVPHLGHIHPWKDGHGEGQGGRHLGVGVEQLPFLDRGVRLECRVGQRLVELRVRCGTGAVVGAHGGGDVLRDGGEGDPARLAPSRSTADSVGDQHVGGDPLSPQRQRRRIGQAGAVHHHLRMHGAEHEMILVFLPYAADVRQAEHVQLGVGWAHPLRVSGHESSLPREHARALLSQSRLSPWSRQSASASRTRLRP